MTDTPAPLYALVEKWRAAADRLEREPMMVSDAAAAAVYREAASELQAALTPAAADGPEPAEPTADQPRTVKVAGVITTAFGDYYLIARIAPFYYTATPAASLSGGLYDPPAPTDFSHCDHAHRLYAKPFVIAIRDTERGPITRA